MSMFEFTWPEPWPPRSTGCICPDGWWGVTPPYCPVHNPGRTWTSPNFGWVEKLEPPRLSDEDVQRIADALAERLKPKRKGRRKK